MPFPHARHNLVKEKTKGIDALVDAVLSPNEDGSESPAAARYELAKILYLSPIKKNYIDASFMATSNVGEISELLDIPADILETYKEFFFNIEGFNKLSKLELLESYDPQGKDLLTWAMASGLTFLAWRLGKAVDINPVGGLKELFSLALYKAKEAAFGSDTNDTVKWAKLGLDTSRLLKAWTMDATAAKNDIEMAIARVNPDFPSFGSLDLDTTTSEGFGDIGSLDAPTETFEDLK